MTKFGAMPFRFDAEGKFVFGKARLVSSEIGARCLGAAMVATTPGAVVFKTEGEPPQVVIVARYGIGADKPSLAPAPSPSGLSTEHFSVSHSAFSRSKFGFFVFSHALVRPLTYREPMRLETMTSRPRPAEGCVKQNALFHHENHTVVVFCCTNSAVLQEAGAKSYERDPFRRKRLSAVYRIADRGGYSAYLNLTHAARPRSGAESFRYFWGE